MQSFDLTQLEEFPLDGMIVPRIRMYTDSLPDINIQVGEQPFQYDRSCPIKGHSAILPGQIRDALAAGKRPLVIERPDRFYVYFSVALAAPQEMAGVADTEQEAVSSESEIAAAEPESASAEAETEVSVEETTPDVAAESLEDGAGNKNAGPSEAEAAP